MACTVEPALALPGGGTVSTFRVARPVAEAIDGTTYEIDGVIYAVDCAL